MKTLKIFLSLFVFSLFTLSVSAQLRVDSGGSVGVGTTTPLDKLDVVGGHLRARGSFLKLGSETGTAESSVLVGFQRTSNGNSSIRFFTTNSGFGSPTTVFGAGATGAGGLFHKGAAALTIVSETTAPLRLGANNQNTMTINAVGGGTRVGIHTLTPGHAFEVGSADAAKPGGGDWVAASDKRLKKDVSDFVDGLEQILAMNPVEFKYNGKGGTKDDGKVYVGVLAQDMKKIAPYTVGSFRHTEIEFIDEDGDEFGKREVVKEGEEYLSYDGTAVTYMLVNAIQEQQSMIEKRDERIADLEARLERIEKLLVDVGSTNSGSASLPATMTVDLNEPLLQNQPNPFNQSTVIKYSLPEGASNASLRIMDFNGHLLKSINLAANTKGEITINAGELNAGTYSYSLVVDGQVIDTKKMILTR